MISTPSRSGEVRDLTVRTHVETDDNGLVDRGQVDIILGDRTDAAVDDLDADLVGYLDLHQGILERLDRTGRIALDDNIEHVDLGLGELLLEVLEGDDLATLGQLAARSVA